VPNEYRNFVVDKGYDCSAAVTKYRAVKMTAEQTVGPIAAAADLPVGIAQESVAAGDITKGKGCPVAEVGISAFEADAACTAGQRLVVGASGNGTLAPQGTASAGTVIVGMCLAGANAQGKRGTVRLGIS
jgi:hypothetical protein